MFGPARNHGKSSQTIVRPPLALSSIQCATFLLAQATQHGAGIEKPGDFIAKVKQINSQSDLISMPSFTLQSNPLSGWPLTWKPEKSQGKLKRTKIVREKSGNLRENSKVREKSGNFNSKLPLSKFY